MRRTLTIVPLLSLILAAAATAATPIMSVPPAPSTTQPTTKAQATLLLDSMASPLAVTLPAPSAAEMATMKRVSATDMKAKPATIGFGRDVPALQRTIALASLKWMATAEGGRAAQIVVTSPGAAAIRISLQSAPTDPDVVLRMKGSAAQAQVMGPVPVNEIAEATTQLGEWWTPILEGSSATLEIAVSAGVDVGALSLTLSRVSHLTQAGASLAPMPMVKSTGIGASGACEIDWKCQETLQPEPALMNAANAVARMIFTEADGSSFLCSGTAVNDSINSQVPYFFTANHCIDTNYAAATLNTYWFYDAQACGDHTTPPPYVLLSGGSTLLGSSLAQDWAMVRLNQPLPAGSYRSAWDATVLSTSTVYDLHHPEGDLKKWSQGNFDGQAPIDLPNEDTNEPQINYLANSVVWSRGVTEPGSSGSGLLTYSSNCLGTTGGCYQLRGGLTGGQSSCSLSQQHAPDYYSRFDQMLPKMRDYLAPGTNAPNEAIVIEYYNASLDHYFMTQSPIEINDLDTGVFTGWQRTGLRFLAYTSQVAGSSPVCRFYRTPGFGDSHFYSASPSECATLVNNPQFPGWTFESSNVFYIVQPDPASGACVAGTHPLWRFFHSAVTNHRYTDDVSVRDTLRADPAWIPEGYGPDAVIMCAPDGV